MIFSKTPAAQGFSQHILVNENNFRNPGQVPQPTWGGLVFRSSKRIIAESRNQGFHETLKVLHELCRQKEIATAGSAPDEMRRPLWTGVAFSEKLRFSNKYLSVFLKALLLTKIFKLHSKSSAISESSSVIQNCCFLIWKWNLKFICNVKSENHNWWLVFENGSWKLKVWRLQKNIILEKRNQKLNIWSGKLKIGNWACKPEVVYWNWNLDVGNGNWPLRIIKLEMENGIIIWNRKLKIGNHKTNMMIKWASWIENCILKLSTKNWKSNIAYSKLENENCKSNIVIENWKWEMVVETGRTFWNTEIKLWNQNWTLKT